MIDVDSRFSLERDVRYRMVDGEVVAIVQGRGEVLGFNATASAAFDLAARGQRFGDIVSTLHAELDVDRAVLEADLRAFLSLATNEGLLLRQA